VASRRCARRAGDRLPNRQSLRELGSSLGHRALAFVGTAVATLFIAALPSQASVLPVHYNGLIGYAHISSNASPPGSNRWRCQPSREHPRPVILVHGTFGDMSDSWQALSPLLYDSGYCVFALNYGSHGGSGRLGIYATGEIARSARQLSGFVNRVLAATHAQQVDIVGHSQGGMMPRYYLKFLGGAANVHTLVGLAPSNHGTTVDGLLTLAHFFPGAAKLVGSACPACTEQEKGSGLLRRLNAGRDTVAGVHYTVIQSSHDEVVTPYSSAFLSGPGVTNIVLQRQCRLDHGEHLSMPYDHIADADVLTALDPRHPVKPRCSSVLPIRGG
jgi:triacylglycerol esterase/lipase EstA (alpha/beta hydrolase family)